MEAKQKKSVGRIVADIYAKAGVLIILLLMCIILSFVTDTFFTATNIINVIRQVTFWMIIGLGAMCIMITGGIDLSPGSIVGLTSILVAKVVQVDSGLSPWLAILVTLGIGLAFGLFNGFFVAYTNMPPFITTLGTQIIGRGMALLIANGRPVSGLNENFVKIGAGSIPLFNIPGFGQLSLPHPVLILIVLCLLTWYILTYTKVGRHVYAIGGNEQAAVVSGVNTKLVKMFVYVYAAILAAISGAVLTARISSGQPSLGNGFELQAIAGAVIGGVSQSGGIGTVSNVIFGTLVIGVLNNGMDLIGVSGYWQQIAQGAIIVLAVLLDIIRRKTSGK